MATRRRCDTTRRRRNPNLDSNPGPSPNPNPNPNPTQVWHDPKTVHAKGIFAHGNVGAVGGAEDLSLDVSMRHA